MAFEDWNKEQVALAAGAAGVAIGVAVAGTASYIMYKHSADSAARELAKIANSIKEEQEAANHVNGLAAELNGN